MKFYKAENYQEKCLKLFNQYKIKILNSVPKAQIEHIGASAIPNCISKGDLDIYVAVESSTHQACIAQIELLGFAIKQDTLRTKDLCMLESKTEDDVAIQLVAKGSEFESFLTFRNTLVDNPNLVEQYNQMKLSCAGMTQNKYRDVKSKFIESLS